MEGTWINGCVSGMGLSVIVFTVVYLIIDTIREGRWNRENNH